MNSTKFQTVTEEQRNESTRLSNMSEHQIVAEYLNYPMIPYNQTLKIDKIGILNFNCLKKQNLGTMKYMTFREIKPLEFPACRDPNLDYEDDEQVAPVIIFSGSTKYQVPQLLWYPLSDVIVDMMVTQAKIGQRLLPIEVFIDEANQWMVPLLNLSQGRR